MFDRSIRMRLWSACIIVWPLVMAGIFVWYMTQGIPTWLWCVCLFEVVALSLFSIVFALSRDGVRYVFHGEDA